jgi:ubiquinone/menaquinone biosynthesis C-methylase UbiE
MRNEEKQKLEDRYSRKIKHSHRHIPWNVSLSILGPFRKLFEPSQRLIESYVKKGQVAADLGCGAGYYTLPLAECVGPEGKVYAVDLDEKCIRSLEKKAAKSGYSNIEARASSASDLSFIKDSSVDFVLANGLL